MKVIRFSSHRQRDYGLAALLHAGLGVPRAMYSWERPALHGIYLCTDAQAEVLLDNSVYCRRNAPAILRAPYGDLNFCWDSASTIPALEIQSFIAARALY